MYKTVERTGLVLFIPLDDGKFRLIIAFLCVIYCFSAFSYAIIYKKVGIYKIDLFDNRGQCQVTYEKTSQEKRLILNLDNCRYFTFWIVTPSLRAHKSNALIVITTARNSGTVLNLSIDIIAFQHCLCVPSRTQP